MKVCDCGPNQVCKECCPPGSFKEAVNPLDVQVGGTHYKNKRIQPVEFSYANGLNGLEASIVKRITRWRDKDGFQDLEKIKHEIDLLIEMETRYGGQA